MSSTVAAILNISLIVTSIAGLTYVTSFPYRLQLPLAFQAAPGVQPGMPTVTRMEHVPFAPHPQSAYEAQRAGGRTTGGDLEAEDVLATVQRMIDGDYEEWHEEWMATADRIANCASQATRTASLEQEELASRATS